LLCNRRINKRAFLGNGSVNTREPAIIVNDIPVLSSERTLLKDYNSKYLVEKKVLVVGLKGLGAKTN
jgi:hypothetical protein